MSRYDYTDAQVMCEGDDDRQVPACLAEQRYLRAAQYAIADYVASLEAHDPILALSWHRKAARKGGERENVRYGELLQRVVSPVFLPADRAPVALKAAA